MIVYASRAMTKPVIVVAGDVVIDRIQYPIPSIPPDPEHQVAAWRSWPNTRIADRPGGALLVAKMLEVAAPGARILTYNPDMLRGLSPEKIPFAIVELGPSPSPTASEPKRLVYRVSHPGGFCGPSGEITRLPLADDSDVPALVVLDDVGNGFCNDRNAWPVVVKKNSGQTPIVLHLRGTLFECDLWRHLSRCHADNLVVVIKADDLRAAGVNLCRRLSWERTATDLVWQLACNSSLAGLANCADVVVTFGADGAIHQSRRGGKTEARLYFDPEAIEGDFRDGQKNEMSGVYAAFVAGLAASTSNGLESLGKGVLGGLRAMRRLWREGFGTEGNFSADIPARLFEPAADNDETLADTLIPQPTKREPADPSYWRILGEVGGTGLEEMARHFVRVKGAVAKQSVPVGRFGKLVTVDRAEIESYRSIRNLMREYLEKKSPDRPLSVAVFGPPGSGKSFGVTQVAESIAPGRVEKLELNVAQFSSPQDLVRGLHRARDIALGGKIPLVFFDEFDAAHNGPRGWLQYFLMPMQDGVFKDGEADHPIGQAIFVFAGGTSTTFAEFTLEAHPEGSKERDAFKAQKGPDFVSRLRGYVDVLGPNRNSGGDDAFVVRRGMLLRSLIERKAKWLLDGTGQAQIDDGVLRALLKVPHYKHGARSLEAIVEMSLLTGRKTFEQAALPPVDQLRLHVDPDVFLRLVIRDVLFGSARESIARAVHERFCRDQRGKRPPTDRALRPWEELDEDLKESNRQVADDIPHKLAHIGCTYAPVVAREPAPFQLTGDEVEKLAAVEHDRWNSEKRIAGWRFGRTRDPKEMTTPYLVPYQELDEDVKEWDRQSVREIPALLADAGFEICRPR
jgi:hypothetical protein